MGKFVSFKGLTRFKGWLDVAFGLVDDALETKQDVINAGHKLSSDFVDDTDKTHKFVSAEEKTAWGRKYDKPSTGIPKADLESGVQNSLGKADSALQEHQSLSEYRKASKQDTIDAQKSTKTELQAESQARSEADTALAAAVNGKVDNVPGKGLSTNDYTNDEAAKAEAGYQAKTLLDNLGLSVANGMLCITYNI